ncbi:MAG: cation:proton antiporter [bacterium]
MHHLSIILILLLFLCFGLLSRRIDGSAVTAPMIFVAAGLVLSDGLLGAVDFEIERGLLHLLLEATLVLVLFSDAANINLGDLRRDHNVPQRMLLVGMPLSIALGAAVAYALPLGLTVCEAALVAAILAPTDAALGQSVIESKAIPARIRRALNVESGLNDGFALPVVLILASTASAIATENMTDWFRFAALQLLSGCAVGIALGFAGALLLNRADARGWVSASGQGIISLSLAALSFILAEALHGNGFIAAFIAGLVFGNRLNKSCGSLLAFVRTEGQLLTLSAFFFFGALLLPDALAQMTPWHWAFALMSLTLLRMLPVALSLGGMKLHTPTQLFLGWFGPRGLASILFVLLVLSETVLQSAQTIASLVFITVLLSVMLHGASAAPLARVYGAISATWPQCAEHSENRGDERDEGGAPARGVA